MLVVSIPKLDNTLKRLQMMRRSMVVHRDIKGEVNDRTVYKHLTDDRYRTFCWATSVVACRSPT